MGLQGPAKDPHKEMGGGRKVRTQNLPYRKRERYRYSTPHSSVVPSYMLLHVFEHGTLSALSLTCHCYTTWVHLKRLIVSPTTKTVVRDRLCRPEDKDCCPKDKLCLRQQTLSSTTNFVFHDSRKRLILLPTTRLVFFTVVKDKVCHGRQRAEDMGCLMMRHHYIDIIT